MMLLRKMLLPQGWYPRDSGKIKAFLESFACGEGKASASISPHAGWYYSGAIAALSVSALDREAETVAIIGGHLSGNYPALFAEEDAVESPLGTMKIDRELRELLKKELPLPWGEDRYADNTVEALVPMARYFFPRAQLLWARFPANLSSFEAGKALYRCASSLGKRVVVTGSTDLTHYGANYGFSPRGTGRAALDWVREENDRGFIDAVLAGDSQGALERAVEDSSACSPGAALGAMGFACALGPAKAALLRYGTSAEAGMTEEGGVPASFVGYASIVWAGDE